MFTNTTSHKQMTQIITIALCVFLFVGMFMLATTTSAFCADDINKDIPATITDIANNAYKIMRSIVVPICIVALVMAGFQFLIGGNQGAEKARKVVIGVISALCFVVFAPVAVNSVAKLLQNNGNSGLSNYNPLYKK